MERRKTRNRIVGFLAFLMVPMLMIGVLLALEEKGEVASAQAEGEISTYAETSDKDVAYFTPGASISTDSSRAYADAMKFELNMVSVDVEAITIQVNPYNSCSFLEEGIYRYTTTSGSAGIDISSGIKSSYEIRLRVNPTIEYSVTASIQMKDQTVEYATSDTRSVAYVLARMKEANDPKYESAAEAHKGYMDAVLESSTAVADSFSVNDGTTMLYADGTVKVSVAIGQDQKQLLQKETVSGIEKKEIFEKSATTPGGDGYYTSEEAYAFLDKYNFFDEHWRSGISTQLPFYRRYITKYVDTRYELWLVANNDLTFYNADAAKYTVLVNKSSEKETALNGVVYQRFTINDIDFSSNNVAELKIDPSLLGSGVKNYYAVVVKVDVNNYAWQSYGVKWGDTPNELAKSLYVTEEITAQAVAFTNNHIEIDRKDLALNILSNDTLSQYSEEELKGYQTLAGTYTDDEEVTVYVQYSVSSADGRVVSQSKSFLIKSLFAQNTNAVVNTMYELGVVNNLSDFNVVRKNSFFDPNDMERPTGEKIIKQAIGYEYYPSTHLLKVQYSEFRCKDLAFTLRSNDPNSNLTKDFYTTNVTVGEYYCSVVFSYDDLEMWGKNNCSWLFTLTKENITVNNGYPNIVTVTNDGEERKLTIQCPIEHESYLSSVSLNATAEIMEDELYSMTFQYKEIVDTAGVLSETTKTSDPVTIKYSDLLSMSFETFMTEYADNVNENLLPSTLSGTRYCVAVGYRKSYDHAGLICNITVTYEYTPIFKVTDNQSDWYKFLPKSNTTLIYSGDYFYDHGYSGGRVEKITSSLPADEIKITQGYTYKDTKIELLTTGNDTLIIPIRLEFSDEWKVRINYMEQYKDTPFAVKKEYTGQIKVKDYDDIYAITVADLADILGKSSMAIINGKSTVNEIIIEYDATTETYTVNTTYTYMNLVQIDYNGNRKEIKVPLTNYKEWSDGYGQDWSILYLNYSGAGKEYFKYSNDVKREDLYGFFSVAIFKEQVSDLNYYFKNSTGAGCISMHESEEVRGSKVYRFFDGLSDGGILGQAGGRVGMIFCELINDENAIYHSYFFFLDGTSDQAFVSNSGATSADDTNSSLTNSAQGLLNWWGGLFDEDGFGIGKILAIGLPIILIVVLAVIVIRLIKWAFRKD